MIEKLEFEGEVIVSVGLDWEAKARLLVKMLVNLVGSAPDDLSESQVKVENEIIRMGRIIDYLKPASSGS
jgi:hypothetical protein|tara:strand:- start:3415 stop:3624 length:210 start_codon:yes stop_codon:yes gene_type:complete